MLYIGEGEKVSHRIRDHEAKKDWWDEVVIVVASANALHKAHVKYLESGLIFRARNAASVRLMNETGSEAASLNEAARANMETFVETLQMVLPALGVDDFRTGRRAAYTEEKIGNGAPQFFMKNPKQRVDAIGELRDSEFVVLKGAKASTVWQGRNAEEHTYQRLRSKLEADGVLIRRADYAEFMEDYAFSSPSGAAAVLNGRSTNGRQEWKAPDGRSFAEWERDDIAAVVP